MKDNKLDQLAKNFNEKFQQGSEDSEQTGEDQEIELVPDELAEKLAGGQNRGCTCTNSGCNC